ncbi:MAG: hypothetical protein M1812_002685 [Candelaria pacifica]|nr:MAG: hypothetical protein M1812_002685 [Candelaria pacifica]
MSPSTKNTPLSTRELSRLTSGDRVHIYISPDNETRESVFPAGVFKNVLTYYSTYCHQELVTEHKAFLWFDKIDKNMLKYAIQWMSGGGVDQGTQIYVMDERKLLELYRLSHFLAIGVLEKLALDAMTVKVQALGVERLLRLYRDSAGVTTVQLKALRRLLYLSRTTPLTVEQIDTVYDMTLAGSPLRKAVIEGTANMIYSRQIANPAPYKQYCLRNINFAEGMKQASEQKFASVTHCSNCRKTGHTTENCRRLQSKPAPVRGSMIICSHCSKPGHAEAQCWKLHPALVPVRSGFKQCSHCHKRGHDDSGCWELHPELAPVRLFCSRCRKSDHGEEDCWLLHPEKRPVRPTRARPVHPNGRSHAMTMDELMAKGRAAVGREHITDWKPHKLGK